MANATKHSLVLLLSVVMCTLQRAGRLYTPVAVSNLSWVRFSPEHLHANDSISISKHAHCDCLLGLDFFFRSSFCLPFIFIFILFRFVADSFFHPIQLLPAFNLILGLWLKIIPWLGIFLLILSVNRQENHTASYWIIDCFYFIIMALFRARYDSYTFFLLRRTRVTLSEIIEWYSYCLWATPSN